MHLDACVLALCRAPRRMVQARLWLSSISASVNQAEMQRRDSFVILQKARNVIAMPHGALPAAQALLQFLLPGTSILKAFPKVPGRFAGGSLPEYVKLGMLRQPASDPDLGRTSNTARSR